jgi:hypothetical protein
MQNLIEIANTQPWEIVLSKAFSMIPSDSPESGVGIY